MRTTVLLPSTINRDDQPNGDNAPRTEVSTPVTADTTAASPVGLVGVGGAGDHDATTDSGT
jgi:hypothetical protein